ncbi:MAG: hypothetical protein WA170_04105, partial [Candidatus Acidiferrales bacterium]
SDPCTTNRATTPICHSERGCNGHLTSLAGNLLFTLVGRFTATKFFYVFQMPPNSTVETTNL